jgi:phosphoribosylformylglycinamidine synthase
MKAIIHVTLKNGVLDPQGAAIEKSIHHLGHKKISQVKQGKYFELEIDEADKGKAENTVKTICENLLANMVVENYSFEIK